MIQSYKDAEGNAHWPDTDTGTEEYYAVDWDTFLTNENDTLIGVTWVLPTGLTNLDEKTVLNQTQVKISAVTAGEYQVTCTVTTTEGADSQTFKQIMNLRVK